MLLDCRVQPGIQVIQAGKLKLRVMWPDSQSQESFSVLDWCGKPITQDLDGNFIINRRFIICRYTLKLPSDIPEASTCFFEVAVHFKCAQPNLSIHAVILKNEEEELLVETGTGSVSLHWIVPTDAIKSKSKYTLQLSFPQPAQIQNIISASQNATTIAPGKEAATDQASNNSKTKKKGAVEVAAPVVAGQLNAVPGLNYSMRSFWSVFTVPSPATPTPVASWVLDTEREDKFRAARDGWGTAGRLTKGKEIRDNFLVHISQQATNLNSSTKNLTEQVHNPQQNVARVKSAKKEKDPAPITGFSDPSTLAFMKKPAIGVNEEMWSFIKNGTGRILTEEDRTNSMNARKLRETQFSEWLQRIQKELDENQTQNQVDRLRSLRIIQELKEEIAQFETEDLERRTVYRKKSKELEEMRIKAIEAANAIALQQSAAAAPQEAVVDDAKSKKKPGKK